jgi:hypothetical protein
MFFPSTEYVTGATRGTRNRTMWTVEYGTPTGGTVPWTLRRLPGPSFNAPEPVVMATGIAHLSPSWAPWWAHVEVSTAKCGYYIPQYVLAQIESAAVNVPADACSYCTGHHAPAELDACPAYNCGDHPEHPDWQAVA